MKINDSDKELIKIATDIVTKNNDLYEKKGLHVGCALKAKSGKIYIGINIKTSHSVCAEQVAIGQALANGEREFDTIVTVKENTDGSTRVISPCGLCRYIFDKLNMDMMVLVEDIKNDKILKVKAEELLPYPYKRNRDQTTMNGFNTEFTEKMQKKTKIKIFIKIF